LNVYSINGVANAGLSHSISTNLGEYTPFKTLRIATFDGESWSLTGEPLSAG
jgi:hypothetical protein